MTRWIPILKSKLEGQQLNFPFTCFKTELKFCLGNIHLVLTSGDSFEEFYERCFRVKTCLPFCLIQWYAWWLHLLKGKMWRKQNTDRTANYWEQVFSTVKFISCWKPSTFFKNLISWYLKLHQSNPDTGILRSLMPCLPEPLHVIEDDPEKFKFCC